MASFKDDIQAEGQGADGTREPFDLADFDPVAYINDPQWHSSCYGLERIELLLEKMGRPQDKLKFVHVAGTNGKGSTSAYIARILQQAGYKTGLFTSPYIIQFEERIRVNGQMISAPDLMSATLFVRQHAEAVAAQTGVHPTEFELMTAVALGHFARSGCDIVVLEVGLGGTLDSTNVIPAPEVCVIARIGFDHTALLGNTLGEIAAQKAGIIKPGAKVVSYPQDAPEATQAIASAAVAAGCSVRIPDFAQLQIGGVNAGARAFMYQGVAYRTALLGSYQPCNAALAIECAHALQEAGWDISQQAIERGVAATRWEGRFEVVEGGVAGACGASGDADDDGACSVPDGDETDDGGATSAPGDSGANDSANQPAGPLIVVDGGHNPQGATVLAQSLRDLFPQQKALLVMGVLADKDYVPMVESMVPCASGFICVTPPNPRALDAESLAATVNKVAQAQGVALPKGVCAAASFEDAFKRARALSAAGDIICAFGSLYSIADIKAAIEATRSHEGARLRQPHGSSSCSSLA